MMRNLKDNSIAVEAATNLSEEERHNKIIRGVLVNRDTPGYIRHYDGVIAKARALAR
jgi:hypothetical protein